MFMMDFIKAEKKIKHKISTVKKDFHSILKEKTHEWAYKLSGSQPREKPIHPSRKTVFAK